MAALGLATAAFGVALVAEPAPASAAYCDDYPFLCSTLTVDPSGNGSGRVTTADGFIDCRWNGTAKSGTCSKRYVEDADGSVSVRLTYEADSGSYLCLGAILPDCFADSYTHDVRFGGDHTAAVSFMLEDCSQVPASWCHTLSLTTSGNGAGVIDTVDGSVHCSYAKGVASGTCSHEYFAGPNGSMVTVQIEATANAGSVVCDEGSCKSTQDFTYGFSSDVAYPLEFKLRTYDITVARAGTGTGRILSSPGGIDCGTMCSKTFTHGDKLTLAAVPDAGSAFAGWTGPCAGQDATCDLTVTAAQTITATFITAGASPGATLPPGATPRATPRITAAPGQTSTPATSSPTGAGESPAPAAQATSPATGPSTPPSASAVPGAAGSALPPPTQAPVPAVDSGAANLDVTVLAAAIVLAGLLIGGGLAFGLRRRRSEPTD